MDWLQLLTTGGVFTALGLSASTWLKQRPAMKQVELEGEAALWARIHQVEADQQREREQCEERIARIEERNDAALARMDNKFRSMRHDRNNVRAGFNALITMIKRLDNPELSEIAATVEELVKKGDELIAIEKGASMVAAPLKGTEE